MQTKDESLNRIGFVFMNRLDSYLCRIRKRPRYVIVTRCHCVIHPSIILFSSASFHDLVASIIASNVEKSSDKETSCTTGKKNDVTWINTGESYL